MKVENRVAGIKPLANPCELMRVIKLCLVMKYVMYFYQTNRCSDFEYEGHTCVPDTSCQEADPAGILNAKCLCSDLVRSKKQFYSAEEEEELAQ